MWISLARRSSALKMVVSTSLMTGRDVAVDGGEAVDGKRFVGVVLVADDVEREAFGDFFEDALGLLGLLEKVGDLGGGGDFDAQLLVEEQAELVDGVEVARIGEGDFEGSVLCLERHEVVTEHEVDRDGAEEVVLDGAVAEVDEFAAVAQGDGLGFGDFVRLRVSRWSGGGTGLCWAWLSLGAPRKTQDWARTKTDQNG